MALCSTHLAPTLISVRAVIYAALQQSRFHTCATKHLFMLPTGLWLGGQPPDSAILSDMHLLLYRPALVVCSFTTI